MSLPFDKFLIVNIKKIIYFNRVYNRVRGEFLGECAIRTIIFLVKHNITVRNHIIKLREIDYRDSTISEKFAFQPNKSVVRIV